MLIYTYIYIYTYIHIYIFFCLCAEFSIYANIFFLNLFFYLYVANQKRNQGFKIRVYFSNHKLIKIMEQLCCTNHLHFTFLQFRFPFLDINMFNMKIRCWCVSLVLSMYTDIMDYIHHVHNNVTNKKYWRCSGGKVCSNIKLFKHLYNIFYMYFKHCW